MTIHQQERGTQHDCHDVMITLRLQPGFSQRCAAVAGDFTAWVPVPMDGDGDGGYQLGVRVRRNRRFRYRFLVDDQMWMNDPLAQTFDVGHNGAPISVAMS